MSDVILQLYMIWSTSHAHVEVEQGRDYVQARIVFCFPLLLGYKHATPWNAMSWAELQRRERGEGL